MIWTSERVFALSKPTRRQRLSTTGYMSDKQTTSHPQKPRPPRNAPKTLHLHHRSPREQDSIETLRRLCSVFGNNQRYYGPQSPPEAYKNNSTQ